MSGSALLTQFIFVDGERTPFALLTLAHVGFSFLSSLMAKSSDGPLRHGVCVLHFGAKDNKIKEHLPLPLPRRPISSLLNCP